MAFAINLAMHGQQALGGGNSAGLGSDMSALNFHATITGEATSAAVDNVLKWLDKKSRSSVILSIGSGDGVQTGDRFEVLKILNEVLDPVTKQPLAD